MTMNDNVVAFPAPAQQIRMTREKFEAAVSAQAKAHGEKVERVNDLINAAIGNGLTAMSSRVRVSEHSWTRCERCVVMRMSRSAS